MKRITVTVSVTEEKRKLLKELGFYLDKSMNQLLNDIIDEVVPGKLDEAKKQQKKG